MCMRERERGISFVYTIGFIVKKYLAETRLLCLYKETGRRNNIDNLLLITKQFYRHSIEHFTYSLLILTAMS